MALPKVLEATEDVLLERLAKYAKIVTDMDKVVETGFYTYLDSANNFKYLLTVEASNDRTHIMQDAIKINVNTNDYTNYNRLSIDGGNTWTSWKLNESEIKDNSITDSKLGNRTIVDTLENKNFSGTGNLTKLLNQLYSQVKNIIGSSTWSESVTHSLNDFYYCNEPGTSGYEAPSGTQWIAYRGGGFVAQKVIGAYMADYAEYFNVEGSYEVGDIICIDKMCPESYRVSSTDCSNLVVGVVSNSYFICTGHKEGSTNIPVGLVGRVPVNVTGKVKIGDFIVTSSIAGLGRAMNDDDTYKPGIIIGQALERKDSDEIGKIEVLLKRC